MSRQKVRYLTESDLTDQEAYAISSGQSGFWGEPSNIIWRGNKKYILRASPKSKEKKIFDPDANAVHDAWKRVQKKCGIKTGDVHFDAQIEFENKVEKHGMTPKQIEKFALDYYTAMGMCKREGNKKCRD
jgi:hypothetical protein